MPGSFDCSIVTPQQSFLEEKINYADVPAWDGQIGFMVNAAPTLIKIGYGHMRLDVEGKKSMHYFVGGGFCQMKGESISIITDEIIPAEQLDVEKAQRQVDKLAAKRDSGDFEAKQQSKEESRAKALLNAALNHGPQQNVKS